MIVSVPVAYLYRYPTFDSEHVDDALYGTEVEVLDRLCGFAKIRTSYGYEGYIDVTEIAEKLASPNRIVTAPWADLKKSPENFYAPVMTLPMGALVAVGFSKEIPRHAMVVLPDKRMFYIRLEDIGEIPVYKDEETARETICRYALSFMGTQYRWGGRTHSGVDCSGLAFTAYQMAGITIWRDADIDRTPGMKKIPLDSAKKGDLFFFPGHVAVCIGGKRFVHSSSGRNFVGINSLDKDDPDYSEWYLNNLKCVGTMF